MSSVMMEVTSMKRQTFRHLHVKDENGEFRDLVVDG